ncbi:MAG: enoyl-CoA hydratase/isomerase family protein, partial [Myxococcales bacterium]|nr:enoyl-CoA hydratase/isomerase family protein [Myxococcales bacterium]
MSDVVLRERRGAIELVTISRPKALNAIDAAVLDGLSDLVDDLTEDSDLRGVVLTGAGEKAFVAGADIESMSSMSPAMAEYFSARGQHVFDGLAALPVPVIAAVNGFALG